MPILNREIPVIADEYVSMEFGTGALKITPGTTRMTTPLPSATICRSSRSWIRLPGSTRTADRIKDRTVSRPREAVVRHEAAGLVIKTEPYLTTIPRSQRGGEIVEPMISTQWFVTIKPLAKPAWRPCGWAHQDRARRFNKIYFNWMENIQDWCISRQLWWGHRIPSGMCGWAYDLSREDPTQCATCGSDHIQQDADVLDTWFSSGLWPFSTLGWPDETADYKYFYPTSSWKPVTTSCSSGWRA